MGGEQKGEVIDALIDFWNNIGRHFSHIFNSGDAPLGKPVLVNNIFPNMTDKIKVVHCLQTGAIGPF